MRHTVELVKLKNGIEGLLLDAPDTSVVHFDLALRAGYYLSPKDKLDTAHIMEHMVLGANQEFRTSQEFSIEFTKNGAYSNAYTGDYHMGYVAECAEFETIRILDLLMIAIEKPLLTEKDFQSELSNVREELNMRRNYHEIELSLELDAQMGFISRSYSERLKQLQNISLKDIKEHYSRTHFSQNLRFIIAGPLAKYRAEILKRLEATTLEMGSSLIDLPREKAVSLGRPLELVNSGIDNIYYKWSTVIKGHLEIQERVALFAVFDYLFSTFHSKVFGQAREKGLVYGIDPGYYRSRDNEIITIAGQVQPDNLLPLFKLMVKEINKLINKGVSEEDLSQIKSYQYGNYQKMIQTANQLVGWYEGFYVSSEKLITYQEFETYLKNLKQSNIEAVLGRVFQPEAWGVGFMSESKLNSKAQEIYRLLETNYH